MRRALTLMELLIVVAILAAVVLLLLPAIQKVRESALMAQSLNNLRQIGLACHQLADANQGRLPGHTDYGSAYRHSTLLELLPYLESLPTYQYIDRQMILPPEVEWQLPVRVYVSPIDPTRGMATPALTSLLGTYNPEKLSASSYAINAHFFISQPVLRNITDGLSQTIWFSEHYAWNCGGVAFIYTTGTAQGPGGSWEPVQPATFAHATSQGRPLPGDYVPLTFGNPPVSTVEGGVLFQVRPRIDECNPRLPNAASARGLQVGVADGSTRLLTPSISPPTFWGLVTHNGGEFLGDW